MDEVSKNFKDAVRQHEFEEQKVLDAQQARRDRSQAVVDNAREFANDVIKVAETAIDTTTTAAEKVLHEAKKAAQPKLSLYAQRTQNETNNSESET